MTSFGDNGGGVHQYDMEKTNRFDRFGPVVTRCRFETTWVSGVGLSVYGSVVYD